MAKTKSSSTSKAITIPAKSDMEDRHEKIEATAQVGLRRSEHPLKYLADKDVIDVDRRLSDVLLSMLAIHRLAADGAVCEGDGAEWYFTAIKEMARANVKGIDACMTRLTGDMAGNFAAEFESA